MKQENKRRFHIILDASNCPPPQLDDTTLLEEVIRNIASLCEMKILHGPTVIVGVPENPGITGFAIIDFSHISIHTFTADRELCVDVFSCKPYDYEKVKNYVVEKYALDEQFVKYQQVKHEA